MTELIRVAIMAVIVFVCFFVMLTGGTFFHERGHLMTAREYIPDIEAVITLTGISIPYFRIEGCRFEHKKFTIKEASAGDIEMDFLRFSPEQIKDIAKSGLSSTIRFYVLTGVAALVLIAALCFKDPNYMMVITILTGVAYVFTLTCGFIIFALLKYVTAKNTWCDRNIIKDPEGFLNSRKEGKK